MLQSSSSGFVSPEAKLGSSVFISSSAHIYGDVTIGERCIVESGVIIGHPTVAEAKQILSAMESRNSRTFDELYQVYSKSVVSIGSGSVIRSGTVIYGGVNIGSNFDCGHNTVIRDRALIGNNVFVYPCTLIGCLVEIGHNCRIAGTLCNRTKVLDFAAMLGHTVHEFRHRISGYVEDSPVIGLGAVIGREAVLIGGISVGDFSLVATNSVMNKNCASRCVMAGNPARHIRSIDDSELTSLREFINSNKATS